LLNEVTAFTSAAGAGPAALHDFERSLIESRNHPKSGKADLAIHVLDERADVAPGHQPHRDHVAWDLIGEQAVHHGVEQMAAHPFQKAALTLRLDPVDDVGTGASKNFVEPQQPFRLFFEVAVDQEDQFTPCHCQTGHQCPVVTEIPRQIDDSHPRVALTEAQRDSERVVRRSIVDKDDLVGRGDR
jgi:hypothetical protein